MVIRCLKEFYSFVDMILTTVKKGDYLEIILEYSGIINRENENEGYDRIRVQDAKAKITAVYDENGFNVSSSTTKTIIKWLSDGKQSNYRKTNSYLSFIEDIDNVRILDIVLCNKSIKNDLISNNNKEHLSISKLCKYVTKNTGYNNVKVSLCSGNKIVTLQYVDNAFLRFVKLSDVYSLYINTESIVDKTFDKYSICSFSLCNGLPDVTSQMKFFESVAKNDGCEFKYITS